MTGMKDHRPRNFHAELSGEPLKVHANPTYNWGWLNSRLYLVHSIAYFFWISMYANFMQDASSPKNFAPQMTTKDTPRQTVNEYTVIYIKNAPKLCDL